MWLYRSKLDNDIMLSITIKLHKAELIWKNFCQVVNETGN